MSSREPPAPRASRPDAIAIAATILIACAYTLGVLWRRAQLGDGLPSLEIFITEYPNLIYTVRSIERGYGLLWNPLQNCGQPFLPTSLLGLPHPIHVLFLLFDIDTAYFLAAAVHLAIGGAGAYLLACELGVGWTAALCSALAFQLGGSAMNLLLWLPTVIFGIYVWMPWAMLVCERILTAPTVAKGVLLGIVLTVQLIAGYPQLMMFTYQMVALRTVWELAVRRPARWRAIVGVVGLGFALPALLGAVQLLPMMEYVQASVRDRPLTLGEMNPEFWTRFAIFRQAVGDQRDMGLGTTFAVVAIALAALAPFARRARVALFYSFATVLFLLLAFDNPLLRAYRYLPLGSTFRMSTRFLYVSAFAFSVMVAFGADALTRARRSRSSPWVFVAAPILGGASLWLLSPVGLRPWEWALLGATVLTSGAAAALPAGTSVARLLIPVLLFANLLILDWRPSLMLPKDETPLYTKRDLFSFVQSRLGLQDRIYIAGKPYDIGLQKKSATVYDIPAMIDHEPQAGRRYGELYVMLMSNAEMTSVNQFYFQPFNIPKNRPLLNLMAARYLIVAEFENEPLRPLMKPPLQWMTTVTTPPRNALLPPERVSVYENPAALPRAFYVPRVEVVHDPREVLRRLASDTHDPRSVALVEAMPRDGFVGSDSPGTGDVTIVRDRSEELVLRVTATRDGFLSLTDQYYPGWKVTVNGAPAEILHANHAFRAVRVPAGESTVIFSYRPLSVIAGGVVTLISLAALAGYGAIQIRTTRRRRTVAATMTLASQ